LSRLQIEMDRAQSQVTSAQGEVDRLVGQLKAARDKSRDTLEDWQKAFAGGNVYYPTGQEASLGFTSLNNAITALHAAEAPLKQQYEAARDASHRRGGFEEGRRRSERRE